MNKYLSLTKTLIKSNLSFLSDGNSKKSTKLFLAFTLIGCAIILMVFQYLLFDEMFSTLTAINQAGSVVALGLFLCAFLIFMFSLFIIPSVYYFSKDSNILLSLPLKPETIIASKFSVCVIYDYMFTFAVMLPLFIAYIQNLHVNLFSCILFFMISLTLPITPLILSSIIIMLIMRFVPFVKNRDLFNMIGGILTIVVAFGFSFFMNYNAYGNDESYLINLIISGKDSFVELFTTIFPHIAFAAKAIVESDLIQAGFYFIVVILSYLIFILLAKTVYFKGVIGFSETGSSRKSLSSKQLETTSKRKHVLWTYTLKEIKLLFRTPSYFVNCIIGCFVLPVIIVGTVIFSDIKILFEDIPIEIIEHAFSDSLPWFIIGGLIYGIFNGTLNCISGTSISREGSNYIFMKYIPVPLSIQLHAKVLCAILLTYPAQLIILAALYYIAPQIPVSYLFLCAYTILLGTIVSNYIAIYVDINKPKLIWEQESAAVKQNFMCVFTLLACMAIAIIIGYGAYKLIPYIHTYAWINLILFTVLSVIAVLSIGKASAKAFEQL